MVMAAPGTGGGRRGGENVRRIENGRGHDRPEHERLDENRRRWSSPFGELSHPPRERPVKRNQCETAVAPRAESGVAGLFIETHDAPEQAFSNGPNMVPPAEMESLIARLQAFDRLAKGLQFFRMKRRLAACNGRAFIGNSALKAAMSSAATSMGSAKMFQSTVSEQGGVVSEPS